MQDITVLAVSSAEPDEAYRILVDFARYPELAPNVVDVELSPQVGNEVDSSWTVIFRNGLLKWRERDRFDPVGHRVEFVQLEGDFAEFHGDWQIEARPYGSLLTFHAVFDLGMPSLAAIIEPIASSTLRHNVNLTLQGLLARVAAVEEDGEPSADEAVRLLEAAAEPAAQLS